MSTQKLRTHLLFWRIALGLYLIGFSALLLAAYAGMFNTRWFYHFNPFGTIDIFVHFWVYGLGGLLLHRACNEYTVSILSLEMSVGFMLFAGFAIAEELFQGYFPHRTMSWTDLLANFAGLSFFSLINEYFLSRPSNT